MTNIVAQVPRKFDIEVARGAISGYAHVVITGINPSVGRISFEDIWDVGENFVYPTIGETWEVLSNSVSDTLLGTGARKVLIQGLDDSYKEQIEIIEMNGTTPVVTTRTDWFRINEVIVILSGSSQENEGDITIRVSGGGLDRSLIRTGIGQTHNGFFTVPSGKTLIVQYTQIVIPKNEDVIVRSKVLIDGTNTFITGNDLPIYQNEFNTQFTSLPTIPEKSDIRFTAKSTNNSVNVALLVEGILANSSIVSSQGGF